MLGRLQLRSRLVELGHMAARTQRLAHRCYSVALLTSIPGSAPESVGDGDRLDLTDCGDQVN